jgi:hypothetical protein
MKQSNLKIGISGKGALMGVFLSMAQETMTGVTFYDRSEQFLKFRKQEIKLGKSGYIDPATAIRDVPLEKMDVSVNFEQTKFGDDDIRTTVSVTKVATSARKVLYLSTKEDHMTEKNMETVFRLHTRRIVLVIRQLAGNGVESSGLNPGGRQTSAVSTGFGRNTGKPRGPMGV